jgi:hypothetical protein
MGIRVPAPLLLFSYFSLLLAGCANGTDSGSGPIQTNQTYTVGGTVSGLAGGQLVLQNNAGNNLTVSSNGSFTFNTPLSAGDFFLVTVLTQPSSPAQSCIVNNSEGAVFSSNVTNIEVTCAALPPSPIPITTAAKEWTWAGGSSVADQAGVYGQLGVPAVGNIPGARVGAVGWTNPSGTLWLFGGAGPPVGGWCGIVDALCSSPTYAYMNDLWKFDGSEWTWIGGSNSANQAGVYGNLGQAAAGNDPGARYGAVSWTDPEGNLWLFGGTGYDSAGNAGALNDLWKYSSGQWAWMGGSKLVNQPGVYGTKGTPAPGNVPGARSGAIAFADPAGIVWLFGGQGCDSTSDCGGALNDLWEYSGGQWTWVSGLNVSYPAQPGVYGSLETPAPENVPGARYSATGWMDHSGNLWVFGGIGYNTVDNNVAELNDLLEFGSDEWTWMGGSDDLMDQPGTYGTEGTPAPGNIPGSRDAAASWADANGNLWLFSGEGMTGVPGSAAAFNDLWEYSAGEWTWVGGHNTGKQAGAYGMLGVPAPGNIAGARMGAVTWVDANGNLWLFGGLGVPATGSGGLGAQVPEAASGYLNDLWVYQSQ